MVSMSRVFEINFDGLIGPTHNFSGLAHGNIASLAHKYNVSSPKQAALQGLSKMKLVHSLGIKQGFIPPQERPDMDFLRKLGFKGSDEKVISRVIRQDVDLFLSAVSASSMWTANAATVSPSLDTEDKKVHITVANLNSQRHRSLEAKQTGAFLKHIFPTKSFMVHDPLDSHLGMFDEGAANHMRLTGARGQRGINVFVFGQSKRSARQSLEASRQIAINHRLDPADVFFLQQHPMAIDRGVFHNDVIALTNENVFIYHEQAYVDGGGVIESIQQKFRERHKKELYGIRVTRDRLSLTEAVDSYVFNSQLVTKPDAEMVLIAPREAKDSRAGKVIDDIIKEDNPVADAVFVDLGQSMANGGGPACLRLRVVLTDNQLKEVHPGVILDDRKFDLIEEWINDYYRDQVRIEDLMDMKFVEEARGALIRLTEILDLGLVYSFQG